MERQWLGTMSWERARWLAFVRFVGIVMKVGPATVSRWNWVKIKIPIPTTWSEKSARIWCNGMTMRHQPRFVQRSMELSSTCTTWQMKTEVLNTRAQGCWWEAMDQPGWARGAQIEDQEKTWSHTLQPVLKREVYTGTPQDFAFSSVYAWSNFFNLFFSCIEWQWGSQGLRCPSCQWTSNDSWSGTITRNLPLSILRTFININNICVQGIIIFLSGEDALQRCWTWLSMSAQRFDKRRVHCCQRRRNWLHKHCLARQLCKKYQLVRGMPVHRLSFLQQQDRTLRWLATWACLWVEGL